MVVGLEMYMSNCLQAVEKARVVSASRKVGALVCYGLALKTNGFLNDRVVAKECVVCSKVGLKDSTNGAAQSRRSLQRQSTEVWRKECDGRPG